MSDKFDWGTLPKTRFRDRKEVRHLARTIKPIPRYWLEFEGDFIPAGTSPAMLNLIKLAFFWGALMTIFYRRDVSLVVPTDRQDAAHDCYRRDIDFTLEKLHAEHRALKN
jgi:hypothetical protein